MVCRSPKEDAQLAAVDHHQAGGGLLVVHMPPVRDEVYQCLGHGHHQDCEQAPGQVTAAQVCVDQHHI